MEVFGQGLRIIFGKDYWENSTSELLKINEIKKESLLNKYFYFNK